ncbi:hypothetical protein CEXT_355111 [Caerostris extrusa]|uniref:Uncharacterized protein n=1 Tax=Caerostris extrusa TaxID=172846 RepID=A0AAV4MZZ0_CAEEX|nr:hypothetical protein CEXT_355111 [Caerostris extrusa]
MFGKEPRKLLRKIPLTLKDGQILNYLSSTRHRRLIPFNSLVNPFVTTRPPLSSLSLSLSLLLSRERLCTCEEHISWIFSSKLETVFKKSRLKGAASLF